MSDQNAQPQDESPTSELNLGEMFSDVQEWTSVSLRAQKLLTDFGMRAMESGRSANMLLSIMKSGEAQLKALIETEPSIPAAKDAPSLLDKQWERAGQMLEAWTSLATGSIEAMSSFDFSGKETAASQKDWRFAHESWHMHPAFHLLRQIYLTLSTELLQLVDKVDGIEPDERAKLKMMMQGLSESVSPSNFVLTNPEVLERAVETRGESLLKGLEMMLKDLEKGQITQTDPEAFQVGGNIANTEGKVVYRTPLFELIQYTPRTPNVLATPLVIFPAWINRFYILDLGEKKSFVRWALDQGISVFMVSWKSADESMADIIWDDYIESQIEAVDKACEITGAKQAHAIGYCVAGTTLAATLAYLEARGEADKIASATFFTAQVDFTEAGELKAFVSDENLEMIRTLSEPGYLDGRYMAATFNLLRGRDLIWQYVIKNYLMGNDYRPMDLLHWNGDSTNLAAKWQLNYLRDLYRDNLLVEAGALSVRGVPLDLTKITSPCFIQSAKEDHIAPPQSVIKMLDHFAGPCRFMLAGSGHVAGVVNPPAAQKYQYWINDDASVRSVDAFLEGADEHPGSWWPYWAQWIRGLDGQEVEAKGARIPGEGKFKAIIDAPGEYVHLR